MKRLLKITLIATLLVSLEGCQCKHSKVTEATCTNPAVCEKCGEVISPALGHKMGSEATCVKDAVCTRCGEVLQKAYGHTVEKEATCTENAICTICGGIVQSALGHDMVETANVQSTCKAAGYIINTCSRCGLEEKTELPLAEHDWGEYAITKAATATKEGTKTRKCSVCGKKENISYTLSDVEIRKYNAENGICGKHSEENSSSSVKITAITLKSKIGSSYYYKKSENGVFLIVTITFTNKSSSSKYVSSSDFDLIVDGNTYSYSSDGPWYGKGFYGEDIQPDCSKTLYLYYDVPKKVATNPDARFRYYSSLFNNYSLYIY